MTKLLPVVLFAIILAWLSENMSRHRLNEDGKLVYVYKEQTLYFILSVALAMFVGLRTRGNDTETYRYIYEFSPSGLAAISSIDWRTIAGAPGFQCLQIILKSLGATTQDYFMITGFFVTYTYLWFIRKYTCNIFLSVFYFITMDMYTFSMAAIKQTLAVAFLMFATDSAIQKRWIKYLFWVIVAELFHPYSFIYLAVPFLSFVPWSNKTYLLLAGTTVMALSMSFLFGAIDSLTDTLGYNFDANEFRGAGVNIFRVAVVWVPTVLSFIVRGKLQRFSSRTQNYIINLSMMNSVIMFIGLFGTANYFARLANYFLVFQVLSLPLLFLYFDSGTRKLLKNMSIICFWLYFVYSCVFAQGRFDNQYSFIPVFEYFKQFFRG